MAMPRSYTAAHVVPPRRSVAQRPGARLASPGLEEKLVFMTGGAFTAEAEAFLDEVKNLRVEKPFDFASVDQLLRQAATRQR